MSELAMLILIAAGFVPGFMSGAAVGIWMRLRVRKEGNR